MFKCKNKKAFISLFTLLFILIFSAILIQDQPENITDFIIINQTQTKKYTEILNIQEIITNTLKTAEENQEKKEINNNLVNYFYKNKNIKFYILNKITNKEKNANKINLDLISKVIILKPTKHVIYKKYTITNSINKNLFLCIKLKQNNYNTTYCFPKNFNLQVVITN
jgi:hypothetical protein